MGRQSAPPHGIVPNDQIATFVARHPDRFVGFAGIDLRNIEAAVSSLEDYADSIYFKGISIEPGAGFSPLYSDDPTLFPLYERAQELKLPVSITLSGYLSSMAGHPTSYGNPSPVAGVARAFPELKIIVSHAAWPNVMPMLEVAFLHENVYVSPDLYMNHIHTPGAHEYINAAKFYLADRLLFGTAYPSRPLKESVEGFKQWGLSQELAEKILHANASRLMELE